MNFCFDRTRFDEAMLYMAPSESNWVTEYGDYSKPIIDKITSSIVRFENNPFAKTYTNEAHFQKCFRENFCNVISETKDAETFYRKEQKSDGSDVKAVTAARDDIKRIITGIETNQEYLQFNPAHGSKYLESLRTPCRTTTLNLLHSMNALHENSTLKFTKPFTNVVWTSKMIDALLAYLVTMHGILSKSVTRGRARGQYSSPVITQMVRDLAILYGKYSGAKAGRTSSVELYNGPTDVESRYVESGAFKSVCLQAISLLKLDFPKPNEASNESNSDMALDKTIRVVIKSLKDIDLTGPLDRL